MEVELICRLRCDQCNSDELSVIGIAEGGILIAECQSCEARPWWLLTELAQICLGGEPE